MKKENLHLYLKTSLILCAIAGISAALIGVVNYFTAPIIIDNNAKKENAAFEKIFANSTFTELEISGEKSYIINAWEAIDAVSTAQGYVYKLSGKNSYGGITLLTGINLSLNVESVVITENTESFASTINSYVESTYNSGNKVSDIDNVDVKCGATYGAKLIRNMLKEAYSDAKSRIA
jgi:Predicted NADH:ubiquinone oxidoreductase, subunit RnfG